MACNTITVGIAPGCGALNKKGGLAKTVYLFDKANLASYALDGTSKKLTTITMETSTYLYKFISKDNKRHSYRFELVPGETVNTWNHIVDLVLYADTQLEWNAINALCDANELIAIVQRNSGEFVCLGLDVEAGNTAEPEGGLRATAASGGSGIMLNDETATRVSLSGNMSNVPVVCYFAASQTLEIAYLDALLAP